ncbi:hypothetical protein TanjilG_32809 [Lupinus angustifolius]|uniref:Uncharacterized protein n=1 Tax=Lupinus angustifolius TaxID=3871 RepID=A0A4P1RGK2_LUPAN|nr:hypothetical protein TanjilG_32809 [Lupinus angustifolius]
MPKCRCEVQCCGDVFYDVRNHRMEDRVIVFLRGLNDSYAGVRSQIMIMDPLSKKGKCMDNNWNLRPWLCQTIGEREAILEEAKVQENHLCQLVLKRQFKWFRKRLVEQEL